MKVHPGLVISALIPVLLATPAASDSARYESRYSRLGQTVCTPHSDGGPEQDWLMYRCDGMGGVAVWVLYQEGVRMRLDFSAASRSEPPAFSTVGTFAADRDDSWPVEWRGHLAGGRFIPRAAIVRVRAAGGEWSGSRLAVYRLTPDHRACLLGVPADNAGARRMADEGAEDCQDSGDR